MSDIVLRINLKCLDWILVHMQKASSPYSCNEPSSFYLATVSMSEASVWEEEEEGVTRLGRDLELGKKVI